MTHGIWTFLKRNTKKTLTQTKFYRCPLKFCQITFHFSLQPTFEALSLSYKDLQNFMSNVIGNFQTAVQYSRVNGVIFVLICTYSRFQGPFSHDGSIPDVCDIMMVDSYNPVLKLGQVNQYMTQVLDGDYYPMANNYSDVVAFLQDPTYDEDGSGGILKFS